MKMLNCDPSCLINEFRTIIALVVPSLSVIEGYKVRNSAQDDSRP